MFKPYIHQKENWPNFKWDNNSLIDLLSEVRNSQGKIVGKMEALGFNLRNEAVLETLTLDVLKSSEIEGEIIRRRTSSLFFSKKVRNTN